MRLQLIIFSKQLLAIDLGVTCIPSNGYGNYCHAMDGDFIPLIKQTSSKVNYLYDLIDAAHDAKRINETSRQLGHVPIIDKNTRGKEVIPMAPHEAERYKIRSSVEWANGPLKEDFDASNVMVKGHRKVTQHLLFGGIVLFC